MMDINLARTMARTAFESGRQLSGLLPLLKQGLPPDEYRRCVYDLAAAIDATNTALLSRAIKAHPALEAEIEEAIGQRGSY